LCYFQGFKEIYSKGLEVAPQGFLFLFLALREMSVRSNPIRLNKDIRQRERCDPEGEPKEGNPKRGRQ